MIVSEHRKQVARFLAKAIGGAPKVTSYHSGDQKSEVGVLECQGVPSIGITSYATVGLSEYPMQFVGQDYPARVEFLAASKTSVPFGDVISTAAFTVVNSMHFVAPGSVLRDMVGKGRRRKGMRHLLCTTPYLWSPELPTTKFGDLLVAWLLLAPISDGELRYLEDQGPLALERLLESHSVDITDLERAEVPLPTRGPRTE